MEEKKKKTFLTRESMTVGGKEAAKTSVVSYPSLIHTYMGGQRD